MKDARERAEGLKIKSKRAAFLVGMYFDWNEDELQKVAEAIEDAYCSGMLRAAEILFEELNTMTPAAAIVRIKMEAGKGAQG